MYWVTVLWQCWFMKTILKWCHDKEGNLITNSWNVIVRSIENLMREKNISIDFGFEKAGLLQRSSPHITDNVLSNPIFVIECLWALVLQILHFLAPYLFQIVFSSPRLLDNALSSPPSLSLCLCALIQDSVLSSPMSFSSECAF